MTSTKCIHKHPQVYHPQTQFRWLSTAGYAPGLDKTVLVQFSKMSHTYDNGFVWVVVYHKQGGSGTYIMGLDTGHPDTPELVQFAHWRLFFDYTNATSLHPGIQHLHFPACLSHLGLCSGFFTNLVMSSRHKRHTGLDCLM